MLTPIQERLDAVRERMDKAARRSGRNAYDVTLLAVTKSVPFDLVRPFLQAGICYVGENRVQEALTKYIDEQGSKKTASNVQLHLIGHLQSNKVKKAVGLFDMVQSVDSVDLAHDLNRHAQAIHRVIPCLIEVKISPEPTKTGIAPDQLDRFLDQAACWSFLRFQGFMGIAPQTKAAEESRPFFKTLRRLLDKTKMSVLSMGMSHDFEIAIEEGATMVRLGTALFGERP